MSSISNLTANLGLNNAQFRQRIDDSRERTRKFRNEARKTGAQTKKLHGTFRGAAQGVAAIDGPLGGVASRLSSVGGLVNSNALGWAAMGVSIAGATALVYKSVTAYERMQRGQLRTEALLTATGHAAGRSAEQLDKQARSLARATLANVEGVRKAQQVMLTFRSVQGDTFDRSISLAQDLAALMGTDVKNAALQLGKALEMPSEGMTALRRSGVSFTAAQKEMVKEMEKTGRVAEAQGLVLDTLQKQIGGLGTAEAGGLAGAVDSLSQSWDEMLEEMGRTQGVAGVAQSALQSLAAGFDGVKQLISPEDQQLLRQRALAISDEIAEMEERINTRSRRRGPQAGRSAARAAAEERLEQLKRSQEIVNKALIRGISERTAEELAAEKKGLEVAAKMQDEAAQARLAKEQEAGLKSLKVMEETQANQETKLEIAHAKRLEKIEALQVNEQQLMVRGFHTMEELRRSLVQQSEQERDMALFDLEQKRTQEEVDRIADRERRITEKKKEELTKRMEAEEEVAAAKVQLETSLFQLGQAFAGKNSKAGRALLIAEKLAGLARAKVAMQVAIAKANALGFPANIPAIAKAVAVGASAISTLKGVDVVAHGGLGYVPQDSTAFLAQGERVLAPQQNVDLTRFLKAAGGGGSKTAGDTNINVEVSASMLDATNLEEVVQRIAPAINEEMRTMAADRGRGAPL